MGHSLTLCTTESVAILHDQLLFLACLSGQVVQASPEIFLGSNHTRDLNIGTPVATLPGAWRYRISAGTDWPGVSIL